MSSYQKRNAIRIIVDCAEKYHDNLLNRSLLFILLNKQQHISSLEVSFNATNFLHLTGVKVSSVTSEKENGNKKNDVEGENSKQISAAEFFKRCLNHKLSEEDFELADDGTTELKLEILPLMMSKNLGAKTVGTYNQSMPRLYTERLAGGVKGCMGFCKDSNTHWMVPNTILKEDIRLLTNDSSRVIATYRKRKEETRYSECVYLAKKIDWTNIKYPVEYSYLPVPAKLDSNNEP